MGELHVQGIVCVATKTGRVCFRMMTSVQRNFFQVRPEVLEYEFWARPGALESALRSDSMGFDIESCEMWRTRGSRPFSIYSLQRVSKSLTEPPQT